MGASPSKKPPPPMVLVPPLFDFPPLGARTRNFSTRILLKPLDDPHVDLVATVSGPLDHKSKENVVCNAQFRWQSDVDDPHTFIDFFVANTDPVLRIRSSAFYPKYGFGAFGIIPLISKRRISPEDYGIIGLRYGSEYLSCGLTDTPFPMSDGFPKNAWLVSKMGRLTAGVQYEQLSGTKDDSNFKNPKNWSYAVGYGLGSGSPLSPSFNFCLELANSSQFVSSFYQHFVVQRKVQKSKKIEENEIIGITNYLDFGFELKTSLEDNNTSDKSQNSTFQVAASWQANKNFLFKGKVGPLSSTLSLAFKSWWKPAFTISFSESREERSFGWRALQ